MHAMVTAKMELVIPRKQIKSTKSRPNFQVGSLNFIVSHFSNMSYLFLHGNGVYLYIANMLIEAYIYYTTKINSLIDKITLSNYFDKKELATFAFLNIKQGKYGYCVDINNNIQEI